MSAAPAGGGPLRPDLRQRILQRGGVPGPAAGVSPLSQMPFLAKVAFLTVCSNKLARHVLWATCTAASGLAQSMSHRCPPPRQFAADRHITVLPVFDMPAHSQAESPPVGAPTSGSRTPVWCQFRHSVCPKPGGAHRHAPPPRLPPGRPARQDAVPAAGGTPVSGHWRILNFDIGEFFWPTV